MAVAGSDSEKSRLDIYTSKKMELQRYGWEGKPLPFRINRGGFPSTDWFKRDTVDDYEATKWKVIKMENESNGHIRQGDVLLIPTQKKIKLSSDFGTRTLALGEVTGHQHRIDKARAALDDRGLATAILLEEPQELVHDEHEPVRVLPKQVYEVRVQRRVNVLGEIQRVSD